jgi:ketosteroid isomerase-like protein
MRSMTTASTKAILQAANAAIANGDIEGFLKYCTDDIEWTMIGDVTVHGKAAVRAWMHETYVHPPKFTVTNMIAEGELLAVYGDITVTDANGKPTHYDYCDVWRFRDGQLAVLRAYAVQTVS